MPGTKQISPEGAAEATGQNKKRISNEEYRTVEVNFEIRYSSFFFQLSARSGALVLAISLCLRVPSLQALSQQLLFYM
jgi:hypothetical protein